MIAETMVMITIKMMIMPTMINGVVNACLAIKIANQMIAKMIVSKRPNAAGLLNCDIINYMLSIANWPLRRT